jgi:hypothetical protein
MKWILLILSLICIVGGLIYYTKGVNENDALINRRIDSLIVAAHHTDSANAVIHNEMLKDEIDCDSVKDLKDWEQDSVTQQLNIRTLPLVNWKP